MPSAAGGPKTWDRGWYVEPTVFGNVDNSSVIAQEEIFGPVLSVIPADDEDDAIRIANDTIYGLNASVFTNDVNRARQVARRCASGTVGHNAMRTDFGMASAASSSPASAAKASARACPPTLRSST